MFLGEKLEFRLKGGNYFNEGLVQVFTNKGKKIYLNLILWFLR